MAEHTPTSEEYLRTITVGGTPQQLNAPVLLAEYDSEWPRLFEREAKRIRGALGERALVVEHAGSTAVPGLAAKPIIDIVLVVERSAAEGSYVPPLEAAGYVLRLREPDWFEHRLFKGPDTNVNLHVFSHGCVEVDRMLAFRDHLRTNADDRRRYEDAKRELAGRRWKYVQQYADAKTAVVADIMTRAMPT